MWLPIRKVSLVVFLVTGATGRTSAGVVRHLNAAGADVRVLVRDRDKAEETFAGVSCVDIVDGPFDDEAVLAKAFADVDVAFLAVGSSPDQVRLEKGIIDGAAKADRPHVVKLSSVGTGHSSPLMVGRLHAEIEDHLVMSGLGHTLLRPANFMHNLFYAAGPVAATDSWSGAAPTGRVSYVDIRDLSEAAALVVRTPALHNRIHNWTGLDAHTNPEIADMLTGILGRSVTYRAVPEENRRVALQGAGVQEWYVELLVNLETAAELGTSSDVSADLRDLLGRELRTVKEFLTENSSRFTS
jgi:uncharacterized protein YbjT (DUF2867 family)